MRFAIIEKPFAVFEIEPLADHHDRTSFECGEPALDRYLRETAMQHGRRDLARTWVLVGTDDPARILAYCTLTLCSIIAMDLPAVIAKRLPRTLPGLKLGRLAVDRISQGHGHARRLIIRVFEETVSIADRAGGYALFVDAKHDGVVPFYVGYGFTPLVSQPLTLFLPTASIRKLLE